MITFNIIKQNLKEVPMKYLRTLIILTTALLLLSACNNGDSTEQGETKQVDEFTAVTQDGEEFNTSDLEGHWWVADFIFTNCETVCIPMTANMLKLKEMLEEEGLDDVKLVSYSVDPERDTPEVLQEYAEENGVDLDRWTFLTGYDFEEIEQYAIDTFKVWVAAPEEGSDQVEHASYFSLVSPEGRIENHYSGTKAEQMENIIEDLKRLQ